MSVNKPEGATHQITYYDTTMNAPSKFYLKFLDGIWYRWIFQKEWQVCHPNWFIRTFKIRKVK